MASMTGTVSVSATTAGEAWGTWNIYTTSVTSSTADVAVWTTWVEEFQDAVQIASDVALQFGQALQDVVDTAVEFPRATVDADARAEKLLLDHLTPEQIKSWEDGKWFEVRSQSGKRFVVNNRSTMNVDEYDSRGRLVAEHCLVPRARVPLPDQLLMQKLMLEHSEAEFMGIANHRRVAE